VNVLGAAYLADLAQEMQFSLWHISTDYVFDGKVPYPYSEEMYPHPLNYYGESKLAGEQQILTKNPQAYIIRTAWLYRAVGNNFLTRFLNQAHQYTVVEMAYDQIGCPTYADDLAQAIWSMLHHHHQAPKAYMPGVYHYAHEGLASRYDFAWAIKQYAELRCTLEPVLSNSFASWAQRPRYSVLNKDKIKKTFSLHISHWQEALARCIKNLNRGL
jgi:dTDP-4-dehydrorhamnose reductase